jgi:protocatechuate 3,4-dioxygenase beta subunit
VSTSSPKPARRPFTAITIAIVAIAVVVAGVVLVPISASAAVVLSGKVASESGKAMSGVVVTLVDPIAPNKVPVLSATTNSSGAFSIPGVATGTYTLHFGATSPTFEQYFGGVSALTAATTFPVASVGESTGFVDVVLATAGTITGKVKSASKSPLKGVTVSAWSTDGSGVWSVKATGTSSSSGSYTVTGLEPGTYKLEAHGSAATKGSARFSGPSLTLAEASSIVVSANKSSTYNFTLGKTGSVAGTVRGAIDLSHTEFLKNVVVTPYLLGGTPGAWTTATRVATPTTTSSTGKYTIYGLVPGTYALEFAPPTTAPLPPSSIVYGTTFLGNQSSPLLSTTVTVSDGHATTGRDITVQPTSSISGTVRQQGSNTPLLNLRVVLDYPGSDINDGTHVRQSVLTDSSGNYSFTGLSAGLWDLHVGSVVDSDPNDGTTENVSWARTRFSNISVGQAEAVAFDPHLVAKLPGYQTPTVEPTLNAPVPVLVGSTLSVNYGTWVGSDANTVYSVEWLRKGVVIAGATANTFSPVPGDVYDGISARVHIYDYAYGDRSFPLSSNLIQPAAAPVPTIAPSLVGTLEVGQTLTANLGSWPLGNMTFHTNWAVSSDGSSWTTVAWDQPSYTLTGSASYFGDHIRFDYVASRTGYNDATGSSSAGIFTDGTFTNVSPPVVKKVGNIYSVGKESVWNSVPTSIQNEWTVVNPDGTTYSVSNADTQQAVIGKSIVLRQYVDTFHVTTGTVSVIAQVGSPLTPIGSTAIVGPVAVDTVATAPTFSWPQAPDSIDYAWQYASGKKYVAIGAATAATFTPTPSLEGKKIRVIVVAHSHGFADRVVTAPAAVVSRGDTLVPTVDPSATSAPTPGQSVGIDTGIWAPAATKYVYRWYTSANAAGGPFSTISGAKTATYIPSASMRGKYLFADVTASAAGHTSATFTVELGLVPTGDYLAATKPKVAKSGSVYTVSTGTWTPAATTYSYQWTAYADDGSTIDGGTLNQFSVVGNEHQRVEVTVTAAGPDASDGSTTILAQKGTFVADAALTTTPSANVAVASTISAANPGWGPIDAAVSYQWQTVTSKGAKSISGATSSTFSPLGALYGAKIRVRYTTMRADYATLVSYSPTATVTAAAAPIPGTAAAAPTSLTGTYVGQATTVTPGTWSVPSTFSYVWQQSVDNTTFTTVQTGSKATYLIPATKFGYFYRVIISAKATGYAVGSTTLVLGSAQTGNLSVVKLPKVTKKGSKFSVSAGTWTATPEAIAYSWERVDPITDFGTEVSTSKSYTRTSADVGAYLRVTIAVGRTHFNGQAITVVAQKAPALAPTAPIEITGGRLVGDALTVTYTDFSPSVASIDYVWLRNGKVIAGQSSSTYVQTAADLGKVVSGRLIAARNGFTSYIGTVSAPMTLSDVVPTATVVPVITGQTAVDAVVTASAGTWSVSGVTLKYQWLRDGSPILGATTPTYRITSKDYASELSVQVSASKKYYSTGIGVSENHTVALGNHAQATAEPVLEGTHNLGDIITSTKTTWDMPVSMHYRWVYSPDDGLNWIEIAGAFSTTFTPTAADGFASGYQVRMIVAGDTPGHQSCSANSQDFVIN